MRTVTHIHSQTCNGHKQVTCNFHMHNSHIYSQIQQVTYTIITCKTVSYTVRSNSHIHTTVRHATVTRKSHVTVTCTTAASNSHIHDSHTHHIHMRNSHMHDPHSQQSHTQSQIQQVKYTTVTFTADSTYNSHIDNSPHTQRSPCGPISSQSSCARPHHASHEASSSCVVGMTVVCMRCDCCEISLRAT